MTTQRPRGGNPDLTDYEEDLGLPAGFGARSKPATSPAVDQVMEDRRERFRRSTYATGLLLAWIAVVEQLLALTGEKRLAHVFSLYPPLTTDARGRKLNSLSLDVNGVFLSLRNYYNYAERVIRHDLLRGGYPNSAPFATGRWADYRSQFEVICAMSPEERTLLARILWDEALAIPELSSGAGGTRTLRPFEHLLREFPNTQPGEPAGGILQAFAFAYYRADSPNLTLKSSKVGKGTSRSPVDIADVDGWIGAKLGLSVEVKDLLVDGSEVHQLDQFIGNLRRWPDATAIVLAREFDDEARDYLAANSLLAFDRERMAQNVEFWDLEKQRLAVRELAHFLGVVQLHPKLLERFEKFCEDAGIGLP